MTYDTEIIVNRIAYNIDIYNDGWQWYAMEENFDGPEDRYRLGSGKTKQEAIDDLSERLEEFQEMWETKTNPYR